MSNGRNNWVVIMVAMFAFATQPFLAFGQVSGPVTNGSFTYSSTIDPISNLYAEFTYPTNVAGPVPVIVWCHGYTSEGVSSQAGASQINANIRTVLATNGAMVVAFGLRERDNADGHQDDSGREIHDIYDGLNYVRSHFNVSSYTIMLGGSGGGANIYNFLMKFPDDANVYVAYVAISDYGYSPTNDYGHTNSWWYQKDNQGSLRRNIGNGSAPYDNPDPFYCRAAVFGVPYNLKPATKLYFYHGTPDDIVPVDNSRALTNALMLAGLNNWLYREHASHYPHETPNSSSIIAYSLFSSEDWLSELTSGAHPTWTFPANGNARVMGYMVTKRFTIWLGGGTNEVADLSYDTAAGTYTVTPLTGSTPIAITQGAYSTNATISSVTTFTLPVATIRWLSAGDARGGKVIAP